ncbi:MAG: nitroreductase family protein [Eubacterium sp.]|nr:nitroreductase family protein [Eubacterium sp.]
MDYMTKIEKRRSERDFRKKGLTDSQIEELKAYFPKAKRLKPEIETEILFFNGKDYADRLEGVVGYMGKAFGAPCYIVILSEKTENHIINAGYLTEDMILMLTEMGVGNCWLTVVDDVPAKRALLLDTDKEIVSIIACGETKKSDRGPRLNITNPSQVNVSGRAGNIAPKIPESKMVFDGKWGVEVNWEEPGMDPLVDKALYAASLAPSFFNRQPYRFIFDPKYVILCSGKDALEKEDDTMLDVGAAMLNFAAVIQEQFRADPQWVIGVPENPEETGMPEEYEYVAYFPLKKLK